MDIFVNILISFFSTYLLYVLSTTAGSGYIPQVLGAFIVLYFVSKKFLRVTDHAKNSISQIFLHSFVILLIFGTGSLHSPFFFLLIFSIFADTLFSGNLKAVTNSIMLFFFLILTNKATMDTQAITNLLSIVLISPVAYLTGNYYLGLLESQGVIKKMQSLHDQEQINSLLFIAQKTKPSLSKILSTVNELVLYTQMNKQNFSTQFVNKLTSIEKDIMSIYKSANSLESDLESEDLYDSKLEGNNRN